ncbi:hypothetical protein XENTR_v10005031 [Xenopus tropicalis]|nr:hypothetical protein XENTR_v10005031 [Xenopus tropicalis]
MWIIMNTSLADLSISTRASPRTLAEIIVKTKLIKSVSPEQRLHLVKDEFLSEGCHLLKGYYNLTSRIHSFFNCLQNWRLNGDSHNNITFSFPLQTGLIMHCALCLMIWRNWETRQPVPHDPYRQRMKTDLSVKENAFCSTSGILTVAIGGHNGI